MPGGRALGLGSARALSSFEAPGGLCTSLVLVSPGDPGGLWGENWPVAGLRDPSTLQGPQGPQESRFSPDEVWAQGTHPAGPPGGVTAARGRKPARSLDPSGPDTVDVAVIYGPGTHHAQFSSAASWLQGEVQVGVWVQAGWVSQSPLGPSLRFVRRTEWASRPCRAGSRCEPRAGDCWPLLASVSPAERWGCMERSTGWRAVFGEGTTPARPGA